MKHPHHSLASRLYTETFHFFGTVHRTGFAAALVLCLGVLPMFAVPPTMTSIFSPDATVKLEANGETTSLRRAAKLPQGPFTLSTGKRDLVQVRLGDGSYVRLAPGSTVEFDAVANKINVTQGTVLVYFSPDTSLSLTDMLVRGNDSLVLATQDEGGSRVLPIKGFADFAGKTIPEGHIATASIGGRVVDVGATDMIKFRNESPIMVDLPGSPSLTKAFSIGSNGLQGRIEARDRVERHEASQTIPDMPFFLGSSLAENFGSEAQISGVLPTQTITAGAVVNPNAGFAQIAQANTVAQTAAANTAFTAPGGAGFVPPPPPPPPVPGAGITFDATGWSIAATGVITFGGGVLTLTPTSYTAGGTASYDVLSLTINAAASAAPTIAGFTGTGITFTANGVNGSGNAFESNQLINLSATNISLTLTSTSSTADISLVGVNAGTGSIRLSSNDLVTDTGTLTGAGGVTVSSGGATSLTTVTTTSATGTSGNVTVTSGGAASLVTVTTTSTAGNAGNVSVTSTGATTLTGAVTANGATAATGGAGGNVTVYGGTGVSLGAAASITSTGGTSTTAGNVGGTGGAISLTANTGNLNLTAGSTVATTGGVGGAPAVVGTAGGTGGTGGTVTLTSSASNITGAGNATTTGGAGGATPGIANTGIGGAYLTTGAGGTAGTITVNSSGSVALGTLTSTGGAAGAVTVAGMGGKTASGAIGGNIAVTSAGATTLVSANSVGGAGGTGPGTKFSIGDGANGGTVSVSAGGLLTATGAGLLSTGGASASNTDQSQKVPFAGNGGNVTVTAGSIFDGTIIGTRGGNGGATAAASTTEKAGIGGEAGNVAVSITTASTYRPNLLSQGGNAGNTTSQSTVFDGIGGKGGNITLTQVSGGTLDFTGGVSGVSSANIRSVGGTEITTAQGGSSSNGLNVNGSVTIDAGSGNNLTITKTVVNNVGNGTAAVYDRNGNGGLGQFNSQTSGVLTITSKDLTINAGGAVSAGGSAVVVNSTGNVTIAGTTGAGTGGITSIGGASIEKATAIQLSGTSAAPGIYNSIGDVKLNTGAGTGGSIDLSANSILTTSSAPDALTGVRTPGNAIINGAGLSQQNGQLYGVNATALAVIATGTITVNKTGATGSPVDVGSAYRQGDPGNLSKAPVYSTQSALLQTPAYTIPAQSGTAQLSTLAPAVILSSQTATTVINPVTGAVTQTATAPYTRPYDDAQGGTVLLTAANGTAPQLVGTSTPDTGVAANATASPVADPAIAALAGGALHNFADPTGQAAAFIAVTEVTRTGLSGGVTDPGKLAAPSTPPSSGAVQTVIVNDPTKVTVNK